MPPIVDPKSLDTLELLSLREDIDAVLRQRAPKEKRRLHRFLELLTHLEKESDPPKANKKKRSASARSSLKDRKFAPKYRDSETGQTWAGRGRRPRWIRDALDQGRKLNDFAVD
jgi:DNA-binding protein H-NS